MRIETLLLVLGLCPLACGGGSEEAGPAPREVTTGAPVEAPAEVVESGEAAPEALVPANVGEEPETLRPEDLRHLALGEGWDHVLEDVRLVLAYDGAREAFVGAVENPTAAPLAGVSVRVRLSSGEDLGPTPPSDLEPGAVMKLEIPAVRQRFKWWIPIVEHD